MYSSRRFRDNGANYQNSYGNFNNGYNNNYANSTFGQPAQFVYGNQPARRQNFNQRTSYSVNSTPYWERSQVDPQDAEFVFVNQRNYNPNVGTKDPNQGYVAGRIENSVIENTNLGGYTERRVVEVNSNRRLARYNPVRNETVSNAWC